MASKPPAHHARRQSRRGMQHLAFATAAVTPLLQARAKPAPRFIHSANSDRCSARRSIVKVIGLGFDASDGGKEVRFRTFGRFQLYE